MKYEIHGEDDVRVAAHNIVLKELLGEGERERVSKEERERGGGSNSDIRESLRLEKRRKERLQREKRRVCMQQRLHIQHRFFIRTANEAWTASCQPWSENLRRLRAFFSFAAVPNIEPIVRSIT